MRRESVESEVKFCDLVQVSRGLLWQLWLVDAEGRLRWGKALGVQIRNDRESPQWEGLVRDMEGLRAGWNPRSVSHPHGSSAPQPRFRFLPLTLLNLPSNYSASSLTEGWQVAHFSGESVGWREKDPLCSNQLCYSYWES